MKRILPLLAAILCLVFLAACAAPDLPDNPNTDQTPDNDNPQSGFSELASGQFAQMFKDRNYYIEYTIYVNGVATTTVKEARNGSNVDVMGVAMGHPYRSMFLDDTLFNFYEEDKTYTSQAIDPSQPTALEDNVKYSEMAFVESGNGPIPGFAKVDGASYAYDEYKMAAEAIDKTEEMTIRFYMADGELYLIYSKLAQNEQTWLVDSISSDIPSGMLQLPSGYTNIGVV